MNKKTATISILLASILFAVPTLALTNQPIEQPIEQPQQIAETQPTPSPLPSPDVSPTPAPIPMPQPTPTPQPKTVITLTNGTTLERPEITDTNNHTIYEFFLAPQYLNDTAFLAQYQDVLTVPEIHFISFADLNTSQYYGWTQVGIYGSGSETLEATIKSICDSRGYIKYNWDSSVNPEVPMYNATMWAQP